MAIVCKGSRVFVDCWEVKLTPKEHAILTLLLNNKGKVVSKEQILRKVWGLKWQNDTWDKHMMLQMVWKLNQKLSGLVCMQYGRGWYIE